MTRYVLLVLILALVPISAGAQDVTDREWVFTEAGANLGWIIGNCQHISSWGVAAGYWWAQTNGVEPWTLGPDNLNLPAQPQHYVSVRMRLRLTTGPTDRFGAADAKFFWCTTTDTSLTDKYVTFKTYGNGEWKTYNIYTGGQAKWSGTLKRFRFQFCSKSGARAEIAWIRVVRDKTPPECTLNNVWNFEDNDSTVDNTPTVVVRGIHEGASGLLRCDFWWRPGNSSSPSDWVVSGIDWTPNDGFEYTYPAFSNGVYDLGVQIVDRAQNGRSCKTDPDLLIDNLTIDTGLPINIDVDAAVVRRPVPTQVLGNNSIFYQWNTKYNAATGRLSDALEDKIAKMGVPIFRYPGGCYSDTFYWKRSIGPVASRTDQYSNGCNTTLYNTGPSKFGIDELLRFCETRGMEPMLCVRFRWPGCSPAPGLDGPDPYAEALADAADLVEYCNAPNDGSNPGGGADWAAQRAANGRPEPYNVKLFEVGNEPWGPDPYGSPGNQGFDGPGTYAIYFLKFQEAMKAIDPTIKVSVTANFRFYLEYDRANPDWFCYVMNMVAPYVDYDQGHYTNPYSGWQTDVLKLYDETMAVSKQYDMQWDIQRSNLRLMDPDRAQPIMIWLTEWDINYNWWYDPSQGRINTYHSKSLKAGISAADTLRIFMENDHILANAEWWHLNEGTWGCILSDTVVNPAYHAFRIFNKHFGGNLVRAHVTGCPTFDYTRPSGCVMQAQYGIAYLSATASKSNDGEALYIVVANKHRTDAYQATVNLSNFIGAPYAQVEAEIWTMNGLDVDDYNHPENTTITESAAVYSASFSYAFPAHSVTSFKFAVAPVAVGSIGDLDAIGDQVRVKLESLPVTAKIQPDTLYVEDTDRLSGIRIETSDLTASEGNLLAVTGRMGRNEHGERFIDAESVSHDTSAVDVAPWGMAQKSLEYSDPDTAGLLVCVWGWTSRSESGSFYVSDGSSLGGFRVYSPATPGDGKFVLVRGVKSLEIPQGGSTAVPVIRNGRAGDLVVVL